MEIWKKKSIEIADLILWTSIKLGVWCNNFPHTHNVWASREKLRVETELGNCYTPWIDQIWKHLFKPSLSCGVCFKSFPLTVSTSCPICLLNSLFLLPRTYSQLFSFHSFIFIHTTIDLPPSSFLNSLCWKFSEVERVSCAVKTCNFHPSCYIVRWRKKGMCFHRPILLTVVTGSNHYQPLKSIASLGCKQSSLLDFCIVTGC